MKKRILAAFLVAAMSLSLTACGSSSTPASSKKAESDQSESKSETNEPVKHKDIIVWTLADDLKTFAERYTEQTGNNVETVVIAPADYPTKLTAALSARSDTPDVVVGEPQMLTDFFDAGFFSDLSTYISEDDAKAKIVDYIVDAGKDTDGVLRALSYQITPGSIIYRRDLAKEVWGTDSPEDLAKKFQDFATITKSAEEVRAKGYHLFASTADIGRYSGGNEPWVKDGKLIMSDDRMAYFDTAVALFQKELIAFAPEWSAAWYASMAGELPFKAEWTAAEELASIGGDKTQVLAYSLPTWGALIVRDNAKDNIGNFGVTTGPGAYFGGGTFLGISEFSAKKDAAWAFVEYVTLNEETSQWWIEASNGDVVSMKSVLEANKDYTNPSFGDQKTYAFYLDAAKDIDFSLITKYDTQIGNAFGQAISAVQTGDKTKDQALSDFYTEVAAVYPELTLPVS